MDLSGFKFDCPVCGYCGLDAPPYDDFACPTHEICRCCGIEFGFDDLRKDESDKTVIWRQLRAEWVANGSKWWCTGTHPPSSWDPVSQLEKLAIKEARKEENRPCGIRSGEND